MDSFPQTRAEKAAQWRPTIKHALRLLGIWMTAGFVLASCGQNHYAPPPPPKVLVAPPIERPVRQYLEVTGNAVAINTTDLVARVPGYIRSINYSDGAFVKKGTLLFTIEPELYDVKLKQARDAEFGARATLTTNELTYRRYVNLDKLHAIAKTLVDQALANRDTAKSSLLQAQENVTLAQFNSDYAHVRAPYDGVVTARQVSLGQYVGGGATPTELARIVQTNPIYVDFNVSELDVLRIRARTGKPHLTLADLSKIPIEVGLQTEVGFPHIGKADYASPTLTASTGTLPARGIFANETGALLPGAFVRVRIAIGGQRAALLVPDVALGSDQGGRYLLVIGRDNIVEERSVTIGPLIDGMRVIESGLGAKDRVAVTGLMKAVPGEKADPQLRAFATPPRAP